MIKVTMITLRMIKIPASPICFIDWICIDWSCMLDLKAVTIVVMAAAFGFSWSHIPERSHYSCYSQSASGYTQHADREPRLAHGHGDTETEHAEHNMGKSHTHKSTNTNTITNIWHYIRLHSVLTVTDACTTLTINLINGSCIYLLFSFHSYLINYFILNKHTSGFLLLYFMLWPLKLLCNVTIIKSVKAGTLAAWHHGNSSPHSSRSDASTALTHYITQKAERSHTSTAITVVSPTWRRWEGGAVSQ